MARTTINTQVIPDGTIVSADLSYPLTDFSSTGIDDNATSTAITIDSSGNIEVNGGAIYLNEGATGSSSIGIKNGSSVGNQQPSIVFHGEDSYYAGQVHIVSRSDNTLAHTAGDISFWDYTGSTWNQNVTIKKDGKVGIGLHNPSGVLHLLEAGTGSGEGDLIIATASDGGNAGLRFRTGTSDRFSITTIGSAGSESLRIRDVNNNDERMRIDSSGNVGIGNTNPNLAGLPLALTVGSSSVVETSIEIQGSRTTDSNVGALRFYNASNQIGFIAAQRKSANNTGDLTFATANAGTLTERMRIDSSGNVGIGRSPDENFTVAAGSTDRAGFRISGATSTLILGNRNTGAGTSEIKYDRSYGTITFSNGITGTISERMRIHSSGDVGMLNNVTIGTNTLVHGDANYKTLEVDGSYGGKINLRNAAQTVAYEWRAQGATGYFGSKTSHPVAFMTGNTERMRILAGGGLTFNGDTATANALDDYEEGTWTPTLFGTTSGSQSYNGLYTKIGRVVTCHFFIEATSSTYFSGSLKISGLPFGVANSGSASGDWYFGDVSAYGVNTSGKDIYLYSPANGSTTVELAIEKQDGNVNTLLNSSNLNSSAVYIRGSLTYIPS